MQHLHRREHAVTAAARVNTGHAANAEQPFESPHSNSRPNARTGKFLLGVHGS
jgi:hypothetical protein